MIIIKTKEIKSGINVITLSRQEPVLWYCQGMFCVIPIQIIKNTYEQAAMYKKLALKILCPKLTITWDQGISVDPKVGYALMGE